MSRKFADVVVVLPDGSNGSERWETKCVEIWLSSDVFIRQEAKKLLPGPLSFPWEEALHITLGNGYGEELFLATGANCFQLNVA